MNQTWQQTLVTQQAAGSQFATFTTAKTVLNAQALYVAPAILWFPGAEFRVTAKGGISNIVTTPGTINFQVKIGSAVAYDTGAIQLNATAHTTLPFELVVDLTVRAVGSGTSANMMGIGKATGIMFTRTAGQTDDAQGMQVIVVPQTAPAVGAGFDSTIANIVDFWTGFSISNGANLIQIQTYKFESLI